MIGTHRPRNVILEVEALEERYVLSADTYVRALYADLLHRPAAPAEIASWTGALAGGLSPYQVARAFTQSQEYRTNLIRFDYLVLLERLPGPRETASWLGALQAGLGEEQLEADILASQENFQLHNSTPLGWLSGVYQAVLNQAPTAQAEQTANLQNYFVRAQLALNVVHSPQAHAVAITDDYLQLLLRNPDVPGAVPFVQQLDQGVPPSQVVAELASSPEFIALAARGQFNTVSGIPPGGPVVATPFGFNPTLGTSLGGNSLFAAQTFFVDPRLVV